MCVCEWISNKLKRAVTRLKGRTIHFTTNTQEHVCYCCIGECDVGCFCQWGSNTRCLLLFWACAVCYRGDRPCADQAAQSGRGDVVVCVCVGGSEADNNAPLGRTLVLSSCTGNTTPARARTHTDIYTCVGYNDFTSSNNGKQVLIVD